jgi:hypothetical protein
MKAEQGHDLSMILKILKYLVMVAHENGLHGIKVGDIFEEDNVVKE